VEIWVVGVPALAAVLLAVVVGISIYNGLVSLRVRADGAWADIEVQLKRRHDLIPNLVETVRGYAGHERAVLERVTELRGAATQATGPAQAGAVEPQLTQALRSLFAVAEAYPQLRANENFLELQRSLADVEEHIQQARRYYNAVVRDLNIKVQTVPSNFVASMAGFGTRPFFELEGPEEAAVPDVRF
jgi:LemA protein